MSLTVNSGTAGNISYSKNKEVSNPTGNGIKSAFEANANKPSLGDVPGYNEECQRISAENRMIMDKAAESLSQKINAEASASAVTDSILKAMEANDTLSVDPSLFSINIPEKGVNGCNIKQMNVVFSSDGIKFDLACADRVTINGGEGWSKVMKRNIYIKFDNKLKAKVKEKALNLTVSKYLGDMAKLQTEGESVVLEWVHRPVVGDVPVVTAVKTQDGYNIIFDKKSIKATFHFTNEEINKASGGQFNGLSKKEQDRRQAVEKSDGKVANNLVDAETTTPATTNPFGFSSENNTANEAYKNIFKVA